MRALRLLLAAAFLFVAPLGATLHALAHIAGHDDEPPGSGHACVLCVAYSNLDHQAPPAAEPAAPTLPSRAGAPCLPDAPSPCLAASRPFAARAPPATSSQA